MNIRRIAIAFLVLGALAPVSTRGWAQGTTSRLALVIGEAQYRDGPLATAANDGGLMADLLRQAGYDVTGAANLSQDQIRATFREFLEKAAAAGPQANIFVYLSGKGVQFAGENYLAPIEATLANSANVPAETVRLTDFLGPLAGLPAQARVVVLDLARPSEFGRSGAPLASGLAIVDAPDNTLVAFNAAPGTIAPDDKGPYGAYAQTLVEMLRQPGLPLNDAFSQLRLRVNEATRGAQTPWHVSKLSVSFAMFAPAPGASAPPLVAQSRPRRPMREVSPQEAYGIAVEVDTFDSYNQFLIAYPNDPLARRVRAMLAARREAITWRRTFVANTPEAYWTYLRRYPRGPHAADAERRLTFIAAALAPPPQFREYDAYDIPPPPPDEIVIVDRRRFYINEIVDVPPPRFADDFLPPIPREYRDLPPPPPPPRSGFLPIPIPIPIPFGRPDRGPGFVNAPRFVEQPGGPGGPRGPGGPGGPGGFVGPGGSGPGAPPLPQGYSPPPSGRPGAPPVGPGGPGAPVGGNAPGRPSSAGGPPTLPGVPPSAQPSGPPTTLPSGPGRSPGAPVPGQPGTAPVIPGTPPTAAPGAPPPSTPPAATPPQTLPRPGAPGLPPPSANPAPGTPRAPGASPPGMSPAPANPPGGPNAVPPQGLPRPAAPVPGAAPGRPAGTPSGEPLRAPRPSPDAASPPSPSAPRPPPAAPPAQALPTPKPSAPAERPTLDPRPAAPPREPSPAPRATPPVDRVPAPERAAPPVQRPSAPLEAPRPAAPPPPRAEPPRAEPPRAVAPPIAAPPAAPRAPIAPPVATPSAPRPPLAAPPGGPGAGVPHSPPAAPRAPHSSGGPRGPGEGGPLGR